MATDDQIKALKVLERAHHVESVSWNEETGTPRYIHGRLSPPSSEPASSVHGFLASYGEIYGIGARGGYRIQSRQEDSRGNVHLRVERVHRGVRVYPSRLTVTLNAAGVITRIKARWPYQLALPPVVKASVDLEKALGAAAAARKGDKALGVAVQPSLEYRAIQKGGKWSAELVWNIVASFGRAPHTEGFLVSATTGKILVRYTDLDPVAVTTNGIGINAASEAATTPERTLQVNDPGSGNPLEMLDTTRSVDIETRDMVGAEDATGAYELCADDDADDLFSDITNSPRGACDRPEVDAHYNTGIIHDYFARSVTVNDISLFGRDGWKNDAEQKWTSLVHRSTDSNESFFSRSARLIMHGDGDGSIMTYKSTLDTCGHEWSHGVQAAEITGTNPNGGYNKDTDQNFVVAEATADWWAACINRDGGWSFAAIFEDDASMAGATHSSTGGRLRGMQDPAAFGQPDHFFADADTTGAGFGADDDGGTATALNYQRLGILDKAAFLAAAGGMHPTAAADPATYPPVSVFGMGVGAFENIFYYAQTNLSDGDDQFAELRQDMIDAAELLYPDACKADILDNAFNAVGIYADGGSTPPAAPSGPDPVITPWGARTGGPPYWQSPDVYVKDGAGAITAPLKGQINRLFANVTNIGTDDADGVEVAFSFKPYGAGTSNNAEKTIGTVAIDVATGTSVEAEIAWDLTDLADTNGGLWPLPLRDFDHFCVIVRISYPDDVDACNNEAQNNFGNVGTADADGDGIARFLLGNPSGRAQWMALIPDHRIDARWAAKLDLSRAIDKNLAALTELTKRPADLPWVGDTPGTIVLPLRAGELRVIELAWRTKDANTYHGRVYGYVLGEVAGTLDGALTAEIRWLEIEGDSFAARIVGRVGGKAEKVAVRGEIHGTLERKTGRFQATFSGCGSRKRKESTLSLKVRGELAASASFSFAVLGGGEEQGIDLAIPLAGDLRRVSAAVRPRLRRRRRRTRPRKGGKRRSSGS